MSIERIASEAFAQLGYADSDQLGAKVGAVGIVRQGLKANGWTQQQFADRIGWQQPNVSALLGGELDRFSVDRINEALRPFGERIVIHYAIEPVPEAAE